jgi:hypothetical protein
MHANKGYFTLWLLCAQGELRLTNLLHRSFFLFENDVKPRIKNTQMAEGLVVSENVAIGLQEIDF